MNKKALFTALVFLVLGFPVCLLGLTAASTQYPNGYVAIPYVGSVSSQGLVGEVEKYEYNPSTYYDVVLDQRYVSTYNAGYVGVSWKLTSPNSLNLGITPKYGQRVYVRFFTFYVDSFRTQAQLQVVIPWP